MIKVIQDISEIEDMSSLIDIIKRQMDYIGSKTDREGIINALKNALCNDKRAVLFVSISSDNKYQSFVFANVASGLESGGDYLWINELYVDENYRRVNLATKMLGYVETWCLENRIKYISCCTGKANIKAQDMYKKNGFDMNETIWIDKSII